MGCDRCYAKFGVWYYSYNKEQDQKDLLNLPSYRVMNFYTEIC